MNMLTAAEAKQRANDKITGGADSLLKKVLSHVEKAASDGSFFASYNLNNETKEARGIIKSELGKLGYKIVVSEYAGDCREDPYYYITIGW